MITSKRPLDMGNIVNGGVLRSSLIPPLGLLFILITVHVQINFPIALLEFHNGKSPLFNGFEVSKIHLCTKLSVLDSMIISQSYLKWYLMLFIFSNPPNWRHCFVMRAG